MPMRDRLKRRIFRSDRAGVRGEERAIAVRKSTAAPVVPIKELACLSIPDATAVMINLRGGHKLFCLSVYILRAIFGRYGRRNGHYS